MHNYGIIMTALSRYWVLSMHLMHEAKYAYLFMPPNMDIN